jgi:cbb3-type cytochrome oxidase subunit 3
MPSLEPIWVVFVTMVLVGCVVLAMWAFRRRRR